MSPETVNEIIGKLMRESFYCCVAANFVTSYLPVLQELKKYILSFPRQCGSVNSNRWHSSKTNSIFDIQFCQCLQKLLREVFHLFQQVYCERTMFHAIIFKRRSFKSESNVEKAAAAVMKTISSKSSQEYFQQLYLLCQEVYDLPKKIILKLVVWNTKYG